MNDRFHRGTPIASHAVSSHTSPPLAPPPAAFRSSDYGRRATSSAVVRRSRAVDPLANVKIRGRVQPAKSSTTDLAIVRDPLVLASPEEEGSFRVEPRRGRARSSVSGRRRRALLTALRRWCRCWWRTRGMHQLQLDTNRCRYCKIPWSELYPTPDAPPARRDRDTTARLT